MHGLDRSQLKDLSRRSNARGLLQLGVHLALLTLSGSAVYFARGSAWVVPALMLYGVVLIFLFCALHETVHRTAFASRGLNDAVAWFCGTLLMLPPEYFRLFHFEHHRYTQDRERDPELGQPAPQRLRTYLWRITGLPYWINRLTITARHALSGRVSERFVPQVKRAWVVREARILWSVYVAIIAGSWLLHRNEALIYWVVPALLGQPVLRLYLMAEHTGCPCTDDVYINTRTTLSNRLVRLLAWQMPYHVEHHAFPSVPFHALAAVHRRIRERIQVSATGYIAVHRELIHGLCSGSLRDRAPRSPSAPASHPR
jgi:fatty acid desaturase